jgi:hypothetical protein
LQGTEIAVLAAYPKDTLSGVCHGGIEVYIHQHGAWDKKFKDLDKNHWLLPRVAPFALE